MVTLMYSKVNKKPLSFKSVEFRNISTPLLFLKSSIKRYTYHYRTKKIWIIDYHNMEYVEKMRANKKIHDGFLQYDHAFSSRISEGIVDEYIPKEKVKRLIR